MSRHEYGNGTDLLLARGTTTPASMYKSRGVERGHSVRARDGRRESPEAEPDGRD